MILGMRNVDMLSFFYLSSNKLIVLLKLAAVDFIDVPKPLFVSVKKL